MGIIHDFTLGGYTSDLLGLVSIIYNRSQCEYAH